MDEQWDPVSLGSLLQQRSIAAALRALQIFKDNDSEGRALGWAKDGIDILRSGKGCGQSQGKNESDGLHMHIGCGVFREREIPW